jgi:hypothetical protein
VALQSCYSNAPTEHTRARLGIVAIRSLSPNAIDTRIIYTSSNINDLPLMKKYSVLFILFRLGSPRYSTHISSKLHVHTGLMAVVPTGMASVLRVNLLQMALTGTGVLLIAPFILRLRQYL